MYSLLAVLAVVLVTVVIGTYGSRLSRTTSDFYVASRTVSPWWNASAIGGEYLSAASFLGVAGLVFAFGPDMLWFPVGYTVGYLFLLALVAAPLRRSGAYTLPDFAEARLESLPVRRIASVLTVGIGWIYLLPQLQGAGLTLRTVTGAPDWLGGLVVVVVVTVNVMAGGMRSITFVQAFQYWFKLTALIVPVVFLVLAWRADGAPDVAEPQPSVFSERTTLTVQDAATIRVEQPVVVDVTGELDGYRHERARVPLPPGEYDLADGTQLTFPSGAPVPRVSGVPGAGDDAWALPFGGNEDHPLYVVYALMIATFLGTMGLPHVVVRFYTNPSGGQARRTTVVVLCLLGVFYLLPPVYAAFGRLYLPELLLTGHTDAVVLLLPHQMIGGVPGQLLGALLAGGAFAAFLSTSSGLMVSVAGVLSQDVLRRAHDVRAFRIAAVLAAIVPFLLTFPAPDLPAATVVGLAFAVAASSFCPLLVLGIWWRGLTRVGAAAGMVLGGGGALLAGAVTIGWDTGDGLLWTLLRWPAAWSVPLGFVTMIVVSLATPGQVATGVNAMMARLHLPESVRRELEDER